MPSASADVVATCEPGSGDTTDRVWGNHLTQLLRARSPTAATIVTSSGLCRHAAWMTIDDATPLTASSGPWSPTTPQSARSTVIGTPCTRSRPSSAADASARRSSSPPRGSSGVNDVGSDPSPVRSTRKSGLSRLRAQRSTVRSSARRASSARSGAVRTRSMRSASTSASSSLRHSDDALTVRRQFVAEALAPRPLVVDRGGDHHERRHQRQRQELHLLREREQREPGGERRQHREHLETALVAPLGDRSEFGWLDLRHDRWPVRRPLELDLAELVEALALRPHEPTERQPAPTERDDVGLAVTVGSAISAVVDGHPVLRLGQRRDR